jgi:hypothetical protein
MVVEVAEAAEVSGSGGIADCRPFDGFLSTGRRVIGS